MSDSSWYPLPKPPCRRLLVLGVLAAALAPALHAQTDSPVSERGLPTIVEADSIRGRPDLETVAEGDAVIERGEVRIRADRLGYDAVEDLARATGSVRIERDGNVYTGPELELKLQTFEGRFVKPTYHFGRTQAGGHAERVEFLGQQAAVAYDATYSSCRIDDEIDAEGRYVHPAWELSTRRLRMNFAANEGIAEGAVLRFYGVPILAAPVLSFPLTDARKSGWLPPSVAIDSKSGLQIAAPYYWNIAPNRDATLMPRVIARRGAGLDTEYRYLEPAFRGSANLALLPDDRLAGRDRYALALQHASDPSRTTQYSLRVLRVSDDDYWKDFSYNVPSLTPRLLLSDLRASRPVQLGFAGPWTTYARVQSWQVLQNVEPASRIEAPYERMPQIGARTEQAIGAGLRIDFVTEFNRFTDPRDVTGGVTGVPTGAVVAPLTRTGARPTGNRVHAIGAISRPWVTPGWSLTPRIAFNAAGYSLDQPLATGRSSGSRVIPTLSVDSAWVFERDARWFGKALRQTLEPRLLYVNTPYREQRNLPVFDSAVKDFNFDSIYTENEFTGVDRVSDSHQLTAGVTTRVLDPATGVEAARLGIVQRLRLRDQRITADGLPSTERWSDLLLLARTNLVSQWTLESSLQYSPDSRRIVRSVASARWSPGPFRTLNATYRLTRDLNEQLEIGWQWPLYGPERSVGPQPRRLIGLDTAASGACGGTWYGVGRVNYSTTDRRVTDSIIGAEYDAGCWIGRVVAERLSTGRSEATTRLMVQLELVGLSRLGSSPLQVLKDNIPGYRLLRETSGTGTTTLQTYD